MEPILEFFWIITENFYVCELKEALASKSNGTLRKSMMQNLSHVS